MGEQHESIEIFVADPLNLNLVSLNGEARLHKVSSENLAERFHYLTKGNVALDKAIGMDHKLKELLPSPYHQVAAVKYRGAIFVADWYKDRDLSIRNV